MAEIEQTKSKRMTKLFNAVAHVGLGFGTAMAAKTAVGMIAASACAPAAVAVVASAFAAGYATTGLRHALKNHFRKNAGLEKEKFSHKQALKNSFFSLLGGALFVGADGMLDECLNEDVIVTEETPDTQVGLALEPEQVEEISEPVTLVIEQPADIESVTDVVETPPPEPAEPVITDQPEFVEDDTTPSVTDVESDAAPQDTKTVLDNLSDNAAGEWTEAREAIHSYLEQHKITDTKILDLAEAAQNGNAQAMKDLAAAINSGGAVFCTDIPADPQVAKELYEAAMSQSDNLHAKFAAAIDYGYQHFDGNATVADNKGVAVGIMQDVMSHTDTGSHLHEQAKCFFEQWTDGFDGRHCAAGPDCGGPVVAPFPESLHPTEPFELPAETQPTPEAPVHTEAPAPGPDLSTMQAPDEMNCVAVIDSEDIRFLCTVPEREAVFEIGDDITIHHILKP